MCSIARFCRSAAPPARRTRAGARRPSSAPQPLRCLQQQLLGPGPAQATIGNGNPIPQLAGQRLIAIEQVTLEHYRPQAIIPGQALVDHFMQYRRLTQRVLAARSEEHTSELQSRENLVCRLLLEKK